MPSLLLIDTMSFVKPIGLWSVFGKMSKTSSQNNSVNTSKNPGVSLYGNRGCFILRKLSIRRSFLFCTVNRLAEHEKTLVEELRGEIQQHIHNRHQVFVPAKACCQEIAEQGRKRCEDRVVGGHLGHGHGHIGGGLEGELPVQRKVPQHTQTQGDEVAGPVGKVREFVEQGKSAHFNQACADGEKGEFENADEFFHGDSSLGKFLPRNFRGRDFEMLTSQ